MTFFIYYRISSLVEKLCTNYGPKICDIEGAPFYAFPDFSALSKPEVGVFVSNAVPEKVVRELLFKTSLNHILFLD